MAEGPALRKGQLIFPISRVISLVGRRDRATGVVPDLDLEVLDAERLVSRRHAELRYLAGKVQLVDIAAANGTLVNGVLLIKGVAHDLRDGDTVTFGATSLQFATSAPWPEGLRAEWATEPSTESTAAVHQTMVRQAESLLPQLARAIGNSELVLHYQPKLNLRSDRVDAVEALVRWQHPTFGLVSPDRFIGLAQETGLIRALTQWAFAAAIAQAREWWQSGWDVVVGVNLDTQDLDGTGFTSSVAALLQASGLPPDRLQAELTETGVMAAPERALATLLALRTMGLHVAIDDFGIGQSSLGYLKELPATELKIDQSFCRSMQPQDLAIVRSAIAMGHELNLKVTAEGVETEATLRTLRDLGCDAAQGYLVGRPAPAAELTARLAAQATVV